MEVLRLQDTAAAWTNVRNVARAVDANTRVVMVANVRGKIKAFVWGKKRKKIRRVFRWKEEEEHKVGRMAADATPTCTHSYIVPHISSSQRIFAFAPVLAYTPQLEKVASQQLWSYWGASRLCFSFPSVCEPVSGTLGFANATNCEKVVVAGRVAGIRWLYAVARQLPRLIC